jgi:hypothetical protein
LTDVEEPGQADAGAASTDTDAEEPWTMPAFPKLDTSLDPKPGSPPAAAIPDDPPAADPAAPVDESPAMKPDGSGAGEAAPSPDEKLDTEPSDTGVVAPEMEPQARPEDLAALAAAMKTARSAARAGKYSTAADHLEKVASLPKPPEHQAQYDRLSLLIQYADNFSSALRDSIATLEAGDQIEVGTSGAVGVVGKTATSVTVRVKGANKTYPIDTLPPGLAVAIADTWLDEGDAVSLVMKAAYLATLESVDAQQLAKARQWLQEAAGKDPDFDDLEKVLDDSYDF